ncbi:mCG1027341, partial [Mus musculus]
AQASTPPTLVLDILDRGCSIHSNREGYPHGTYSHISVPYLSGLKTPSSRVVWGSLSYICRLCLTQTG